MIEDMAGISLYWGGRWTASSPGRWSPVRARVAAPAGRQRSGLTMPGGVALPGPGVAGAGRTPLRARTWRPRQADGGLGKWPRRTWAMPCRFLLPTSGRSHVSSPVLSGRRMDGRLLLASSIARSGVAARDPAVKAKRYLAYSTARVSRMTVTLI